MSVEIQHIPYGAEDLILEYGRLAKQANASVLATVGGTVALVSVVADDRPAEGQDFFPLMVDYREKYYAAGKFPGGFFKREGRPGDLETLKCRLIDRAIRPLFPEGYNNEVQVYVLVLSMDQINAAETAALTAASAALNLSDIPFSTPLAAVRVGRIDGELVLNPTFEQMDASDLDLVVAGTKTAVNMVEAGASELDESQMIKALSFAHEAIKAAIAEQEKFIARCAKPKASFQAPAFDAALVEAVKRESEPRLGELLTIYDKDAREERMREIRDEVAAALADSFPEKNKDIAAIFHDVHKTYVRRKTIDTGIRSDGRKFDEIRPITGEVSVLPKSHGSAVFTRGQTQALAVVTLGTVADQQKFDDIRGISYKKFMLHYNFPAFSVGETRRISGPGRREIGHGSLAERALVPVIPEADAFPYTIRVVSEILESNGSSSMASVCGGTMALMDAGVPIKKPVAGIAMGLIKEGDEVAVLSDIQGIEDHLGDMDFKVTGTRDGITALQMDIKCEGVSEELLAKALKQAKDGREHILGKMLEVLPQSRADLAPHAPRIEVVRIPVDKIKDVIGPGGKIIRAIVEETGAKIDIEDDGTVYIAATEGPSMKAAIDRIRQLTAEVEVGQIYTGKVNRITEFGAFVELLPNKDGLVHISELEVGRVDKVEDVCREGDMLTVKVIEIDDIGRVRLSRKAILMGDEYEMREKPSSGGGGRSGGRSGGGRSGGPRRGGR